MLSDVLQLAHDLICNAHNLPFLLLQLNKPRGNCWCFPFLESNLRRLLCTKNKVFRYGFLQ